MTTKKSKYDMAIMTLSPQAVKYYLNENEGVIVLNKEQKEVLKVLRSNEYDISLLETKQKDILVEMYVDRCFPQLPGQCHPIWNT